jgi:L-lactate utilization protein LutC
MSETRASRDAILKRLKESAPRSAARARDTGKPQARPSVDIESLVKDFSDHAVFAGAIVKRIPDTKKAGNEAVGFMKELGFSSALLSAERIVAQSDIKETLAAAGLRVSIQGSDPASHRESSFDSDVGFTGALAGVAETGTVVLALGDGYSRLISHAPFAHVVLLPVKDIVTDTHHFWSLMTDKGLYAERRTADFGKQPTEADGRSRSQMGPPAIAFITGPSMTADIALTAVRGIHGPGKVLILLINR